MLTNPKTHQKSTYTICRSQEEHDFYSENTKIFYWIFSQHNLSTLFFVIRDEKHTKLLVIGMKKEKLF